MRIALVTCHPFPDGVVDDEKPLRDALGILGADVAEPPWDADVDWSGFDAVLLRTPWDYQARPDEFMQWCERVGQVTRLVHDANIVRWNLDKRYLAELAGRGVPIADTIWLDVDFLDRFPSRQDRIDALRETMEARGWTRGFLKPVVGANALLTLRFDTTDAGLAAAADHLASHPRAFMFQPYLERVETEGECSLIWIDGRWSHGVRKVPATGDFRVQEDWGAKDHVWEADAPAKKVAQRALDVVSRKGFDLLYARVDLLETGAGTYVVNELELVEPALFMRHRPLVGEWLARGLLRRL